MIIQLDNQERLRTTKFGVRKSLYWKVTSPGELHLGHCFLKEVSPNPAGFPTKFGRVDLRCLSIFTSQVMAYVYAFCLEVGSFNKGEITLDW